MPQKRVPPHGWRRAQKLGVRLLVAVSVVLATGCGTAPRHSTSSGLRPVHALGPHALGVNVAAWDSTYTGPSIATINELLHSAGLRLLRYPGGSWADEYDWSTNTDHSKCTGSVTSACTAIDPLGVDAFGAQAVGAGASTFMTVNYGSGTPTQAANWVVHVQGTKGSAVSLWEVGNETYSCHEANGHLAGPPTYVGGYQPNGSVCPTTAVMAASYAANFLPYLTAMKVADHAARIGVPWAFTSAEAAGAAVPDASRWNQTILRAGGTRVSFVDAHWYPFDTVSGLTDQQIVESVKRIPSAAATIRATLDRFAPHATIVVGETNISERATTLAFQPVSALFAAATSLEWLSQGVQSVAWWDLNNFGSPSLGDYGLVSSGSPELQPVLTPLPPYYGERLAGMLTGAGARLVTLSTGSTSILGFRSDTGKQRRVLLVNTGPRAVGRVTRSWFAKSSALEVSTYSASTANSRNPIAASTLSPSKQISLPAQSIVVLSGPLRP